MSINSYYIKNIAKLLIKNKSLILNLILIKKISTCIILTKIHKFYI